MRTKVTLVLIFLNVALFFFIFKFERNWRTEAASLEARRRVLGPEAADIRAVEVTSSAANGSFALVRQRDNWFLTQPLDWPANPHAARSIVDELQLLEHDASFRVEDLAKNNQTLADFGLDRPKLTIAFSSGEPAAVPPAAGGTAAPPRTVLRVGDTTKDGKRLYVLSPGGDRVHVVNRRLIDTLSIPLEQLRADSLLTVKVFEARSLSVQSAAADPARAGTAGLRVRIRRDGTRWTFETPIVALASKTTIELVISELNTLRASAFVPAGPAALPAAAPQLRVTIEGNNRHETLYLGERVPPPPAPASATTPRGPAPTVEFFAQLEGRNALFTVAVPAKLLDALQNAQEALREKRILEFEPGAVTAITLESPVLPDQPPLTLQRLETTATPTPGAGPAWQMVRRTPDPQNGPQTLAADRASVQRLLERLALLGAERFKSDAPTSADLEEWGFNRPVRAVTLTLANNASPLVLRLGTDAARNVYARVGTGSDPGTAIYQVPDILGDLPLAPIAWRDRAVMEPLPAAARIAALKLTDLETKKVLFEAALDATGAPTPVPADAAALGTVVNALRNLRARQFVAGGFSERVTAAGEDRPWRFQLDAAIAFPAAGGTEQVNHLTLFMTERLGGSEQFGGIKELNTVFTLEQPLVDALWSLAYGRRDPGPPPEQRK